MYRCHYPDGTAVEAVEIERIGPGQLEATMAAMVNNDAIHRARINLLSQRDQDSWDLAAARLDGRFSWQARRQSMLTGILAREQAQKGEEIEEEATPPSPAPALEPVLPFPIWIFPPKIKMFVNKAAEAFPCPVDFAGVLLLPVCGAAIGNTRVLEVKPGWFEGARIYAGLVAPSGTKKSPVLKLVLSPLTEQQRQMKIEYDEAQAPQRAADGTTLYDGQHYRGPG